MFRNRTNLVGPTRDEAFHVSKKLAARFVERGRRVLGLRVPNQPIWPQSVNMRDHRSPTVGPKQANGVSQ